MNAFGKFLDSKEGRLLSRSQWAVKIKVSPSFIAHLASGIRLPGLATAHRIEEATNGVITMQSWFGGPLGDTLQSLGTEDAAAP
jgi:hypothetical protein